MIHKHIKSLPHHPKRVIVISLIIALAIGIFGFTQINKKVITTVINDDSSITKNREILSPQNLTLGFLAGGRIKSVSVKVGDTVKKGQVLAELDAGNTVGILTQAKAAYTVAQANYQKVINGATGPTIDVAKAVVHTAQINLSETTKQQEILVANAYRTLLNSTFVALTVGDYDAYDAPTVSGTYTCDKEGAYNLKSYSSAGGISVNYSGLEQGSLLLTDIPRPMGSCGLFLSFDKTKTLQAGIEFKIDVPNKNASNYNSNYNAYQLALQTRDTAIAGAQATLDQANASLTALATSARREDVAVAEAQVNSALGSVQIAEAAYSNTIITTPSDGIVTAVVITPGQIALPSTSAIELKISNSLN